MRASRNDLDYENDDSEDADEITYAETPSTELESVNERNNEKLPPNSSFIVRQKP